MSNEWTVVVLAAGRGERFRAAGSIVHKLDALLAGKRVIDRCLDAVRASDMAFHVVDAHPERVNMGDSIAAGVAASPQAAGWLLLPADLPLVLPQTLRDVVAHIESTGAQAARPRFAGQLGHPVGFVRSKFAELLHCKGKSGAAHVFKGSVATVFDANDVGCVLDIDTPERLRMASDVLRSRRVAAS